MSKVCSRCEESKPVEAFGKNKTKTDGLVVWCRTCTVEYRKEYYAKNKEKVKECQKRYRAKNIEKVKALDKKRYEKNKEKIKEQTIKNKDRRAKVYRAWREANKEKRQEYQKEWHKNNPDKARHYANMRHAVRMQRTPCWLTEYDRALIQRKYTLASRKTESTGERWVVDHILPLQGKLVSGLHVPANLRVVKEITNLRKHNKYIPV